MNRMERFKERINEVESMKARRSKRMSFNKLTEISTDIVNCTLAKKEQKETLRKDILMMVALSCQEYARDQEFKAEVDRYISWMRPGSREKHG